MHVLVTGGAGYVGSNVVRALLDTGHRVSVIDDLSSGHREALPPEAELTVGRCGDRAVLDAATAGSLPDGVMHMAAKCSVGESMSAPRAYYDTNLRESLGLLDWMVDRSVGWIIHSSTCAVYGEPSCQPMDENATTLPINAYGATKLAVDQAIRYYVGAYEMAGTSLRYFNAAGAHADGTLGEDKTPASNLIPRVLAVALGRHERIDVYGDDFDSIDGTGVRDYVHIADLAAAHLAAMERLSDGDRGSIYNLGSETGNSVLQVVAAARQATGHPIPISVGARRPGDPPVLFAASGLARRELAWQPCRSDLQEIINDAWRWHSTHPLGYGEAALESEPGK